MRRLFILMMFFIPVSLLAQYDFQYKADLPHIDSTYFYNIYLPPRVTSKLNFKFSDIRIYDSRGREVPYIRDTEENRYKTARRKRLKIIQNEHKLAKKYTVVLIHNPRKEMIKNLMFTIRNTDAEIWLNISGSDDLKNWQILKNNVLYQHEFSDSATAMLVINDLPASNFEYYRIIFFDYNKEPILVYDANTLLVYNHKVEYVKVPKPHFVQDDTSEVHRTILHIWFDQPQYIDKIVFKIDTPQFYLRKAELTTRDTSTGRKIRLKYYFQNQKDFYLCSDSSNQLLLSRYFVKDLYLTVENNNNQPLHFVDVEAYQQKEYIIANLVRNRHYVIKFGNKNVPAPIYDLKYFQNKIPKDRPTITVGKIIRLSKFTEKDTKVYIKPVYLWILLGIILIIMILITISLFKKHKPSDLV